MVGLFLFYLKILFIALSLMNDPYLFPVNVNPTNRE